MNEVKSLKDLEVFKKVHVLTWTTVTNTGTDTEN